MVKVGATSYFSHIPNFLNKLPRIHQRYQRQSFCLTHWSWSAVVSGLSEKNMNITKIEGFQPLQDGLWTIHKRVVETIKGKPANPPKHGLNLAWYIVLTYDETMKPSQVFCGPRGTVASSFMLPLQGATSLLMMRSGWPRWSLPKEFLPGWWFQRFFIFTAIWGRFPIWRACFSDGLVQPPTSFKYFLFWMENWP